MAEPSKQESPDSWGIHDNQLWNIYPSKTNHRAEQVFPSRELRDGLPGVCLGGTSSSCWQSVSVQPKPRLCLCCNLDPGHGRILSPAPYRCSSSVSAFVTHTVCCKSGQEWQTGGHFVTISLLNKVVFIYLVTYFYHELQWKAPDSCQFSVVLHID